jgi:uncharacterized membrane protein
MNKKINIKKTKNEKILLYLILFIVLIVGIFFRFSNLDGKVYWGDETVTSLRISGYTLEELQQLAFNGEEISVETLHKYQYPNLEKNWLDTVKGLAAEEPQHPPFYFLMVKFWVRWFGNSVAVTRSFSAVISLLAFPCLYWLCQELFNSSLTSSIAVALVAVSPFHLLYAQEARSYSLWTVTILLASAALLRAMRLQTPSSWAIYSVTLAVGLYTYLLSGTIAIGHAIYVLIIEKFALSKTIKAYLLASLAAIIMFLPWIIAVVNSVTEADTTTSWTKLSFPLNYLIKTWMLNCSRIFVDFNYNFVNRNIFLYLIIIILITLVAYSIYFLCCHTPKQAWLFILTLIAVTALVLVLPDLTWGGIRSSVARYLIPCYLGIEIAVAYLLANKISITKKQPQSWKVVTLILLFWGIISCAVSSRSEVWWNKYNAIHVPQLAQIVNQSDSSLVITSWHYLMIFSHVFNSQVKMQTGVHQPVSTTSEKNMGAVNSVKNNLDERDIFVHNSVEVVESILKQAKNYYIEEVYNWKENIEPVYETKTKLWKVSKIRENTSER